MVQFLPPSTSPFTEAVSIKVDEIKSISLKCRLISLELHPLYPPILAFHKQEKLYLEYDEP